MPAALPLVSASPLAPLKRNLASPVPTPILSSSFADSPEIPTSSRSPIGTAIGIRASLHPISLLYPMERRPQRPH
eukprot:g12270.t1